MICILTRGAISVDSVTMDDIKDGYIIFVAATVVCAIDRDDVRGSVLCKVFCEAKVQGKGSSVIKYQDGTRSSSIRVYKAHKSKEYRV